MEPSGTTRSLERRGSGRRLAGEAACCFAQLDRCSCLLAEAVARLETREAIKLYGKRKTKAVEKSVGELGE